jgi:hypothetical protein
MRLRRFGLSLMTALASADLLLEVVLGLLRLARLNMSRGISCTNACTNQPPGLLVRLAQHDRPMWRTRAREIRRSGHIVQGCPLRSVGWADIPQLSAWGGRCLPAWQQYWQQSLRARRLAPRRPGARHHPVPSRNLHSLYVWPAHRCGPLS